MDCEIVIEMISAHESRVSHRLSSIFICWASNFAGYHRLMLLLIKEYDVEKIFLTAPLY